MASSGCRVMRAAVEAGGIVDLSNTEPGACPADQAKPRVRYDMAARVARAKGAMPAREAIGRVYLPARPLVEVGSRLVITAMVGPVRVSRQVTALQAARPGQRFFVRDEQGKIFAAPPLTEEATQ